MESMNPSTVQMIGKSIGDMFVTKVVGPFAESIKTLKEYKEVKATGDGIRAATEFGDGTGTGADR